MRADSNITRLAVIVSHPIQYYVPLYRRIAVRGDIEVKVFFTWHAAAEHQPDHGFKREVKWDIPLTEGYDFELVPNKAGSPGTHHFWGLQNPTLVARVIAWEPDVVQITGYAFASHLQAICQLRRRRIPILFRGDSHLLDRSRQGLRWWLKRIALAQVYRGVTCLYVGKNNYDYYRAVGVQESRLFYCPHSIDVERFAEPNEDLERKAQAWRDELQIPKSARVLLFAGKFERKKQPIELMKAVLDLAMDGLVLVMVGNGELEHAVAAIASEHPAKFRVLPFQNQSKMPLVYRLSDVFTLPSAYGETWGLAVNEALACGRKVLVSDKVGCGPDIIIGDEVGRVFKHLGVPDFGSKLRELLRQSTDRQLILREARRFDLPATENALCAALHWVVNR